MSSASESFKLARRISRVLRQDGDLLSEDERTRLQVHRAAEEAKVKASLGEWVLVDGPTFLVGPDGVEIEEGLIRVSDSGEIRAWVCHGSGPYNRAHAWHNGCEWAAEIGSDDPEFYSGVDPLLTGERAWCDLRLAEAEAEEAACRG